MILEGNARGGAKNLALHLMKDENDHVEIHELRGFMSDGLMPALNEVHAVSRGTKARKFLFSLSLNPPEPETVSTLDFIDAIERVEHKLALDGQPRVIVFHEKQGRRHCHAVWSRIDSAQMKAIPLPFYKMNLQDVSRELYFDHGWTMPKGFISKNERSLDNFTLAQWQQAKRIGKDTKAIKATIRDCWAASDNQASFQQSLKEQGYVLAQGSRRSFVVVDQSCEIFAVPKWLGLRVKEVRARLTDQESLPTVEQAKADIAKKVMNRLSTLRQRQANAIQDRVASLKNEAKVLKQHHMKARYALAQMQEVRTQEEIQNRQQRFRQGISGLWDRLTGRRKRIAKQNEQETVLAVQRDREEKDQLIFEQLKQSRSLQGRLKRLQSFVQRQEKALENDINQYQSIRHGMRDIFERKTHPRLERNR